MKLAPVSLLLVLAGCPAPTQSTCDEPFEAFEDLDGDGFGAASLGEVCELADGQVKDPLDCDDANPEHNPDTPEICNGADDDCDGSIDEGMETALFFEDKDGDGFGAVYPGVLACEKPGDGWVKNNADCNDEDPAHSPAGQEVCGGIDEDCDGLLDDADDTVDPNTFTRFYQDQDHDGKGNPEEGQAMCKVQFGFSDNADDCDDGNALVGQYKFYADEDLDGYGDPNVVELACSKPAGTVNNSLDCDDLDPEINIERDWFTDADGDGFGAGVIAAVSCFPPTGMSEYDNDCDDTLSGVNPFALEVCENSVDEDCDTLDLCDTCDKLKTQTPTLADGVYTIDRVSGSTTVYCDMTTDGGGWTLVSSSRAAPDEASTSFKFSDLTTLNPVGTNNLIWDGLKAEMGPRSDIRFMCKVGGATAVDLSFYRSIWYDEFTDGTTDKSVCFEEDGGCCNSIPSERRNNLNGDTRPRGDDWDFGFLEGEDTCNDSSDFAIDFDDGGMNGNPNDGTDWGSANGVQRCGTSGVSGTFFIFVRESIVAP